MPLCPSCRSPVAEGKRFCADCGAALNITSAPTETSHGRIQPGGIGREEGVPRPGAPHAAAAPPEAASGGRGRDARFIPGATAAGRYRIVGLLGRGGMGEVYRADDLKLGQPVALKFLPSNLRPGDRRFERLLSEVRMARQVSHPNVCRVYDAGEVDGEHFLSMEYIDGEDLASLLRRIGRLPKDKAIELARQLCAGLNAAHEQGILHRDLKPANVMIDGRGRAKITDFGLAALSRDLGGEDPSAGTPAYMAPEQLAGREVTVRSDLYALGLVLYELFTGRMPFGGGSLEEVVRQRSEAGVSSPSEHVEGFDPAVERAILRCLENDPQARPVSALAVSAALPGGDPLAAALAAGETPSPEMVAAAGEKEAMRPGRALLLAALGVGLFLAGTTLDGRDDLRAWLPMDKPPAVMIDRARSIIAGLDYREPVYAAPADTAFGYTLFEYPIDDIRRNDPSPDRWERLRDPDAGVLRFWYRQSPLPFAPSPPERGPGSGGRVLRWDPFPQTTGEILVSIEPDGRLSEFVAVPRRFSGPVTANAEYDWSVPFDLAGLDMADFEPAEPRYQRYMQHDQRAAWVPRDPRSRYRIEAGVNEGRLSLFTKLDLDEAEELAAEPREFVRPIPDIFGVFTLSILVISAFVARANLRRGRADRSAAIRLGAIAGTSCFAADILAAHGLFSRLAASSFCLTRGLAVAVLTTLLYLAIEPHIRATWPSILATWNRVIGRPGPFGRDPGIGHAVLTGLTAGAAVSMLSHPAMLLASLWDGAPVRPFPFRWTILLSQKDAWCGIVANFAAGIVQSLLLVFLLVVARKLLRRPLPAAAAAWAIWTIPDLLYFAALTDDYGAAQVGADLAVSTIQSVVLILVMLRWGLVGGIVTMILGRLTWLSATPDWSAWHAQPAILCAVVVTALAAYGYWSATPAARKAHWSGP